MFWSVAFSYWVAIGLNKVIYIPVFVIYLLGALIRLAYFNMLENVRQLSIIPTEKSFIGLPVTSSALIFPFIYIFKKMSGTYFPIIYLITMFVVGILFVTKIKIKKPSLKFMIVMLFMGIIELLVILISLGII